MDTGFGCSLSNTVIATSSVQEMIHDGYERRATIGSWRVVYRPALATEHRRFRWMLSALDDESAYRETDKWLAGKIVAWTRGATASIESLQMLRFNRPGDYEKLLLVVSGLIADDSGKAWKDIEAEYASNLYYGVLLELTNPRLAKRSCEDCKKWWFSDSTGLPILSNTTGEKMLRDGVTACMTAEGCPKGTPEKSKALNKTNGWAWRHYQDCVAVGQFPDDPIVSRNASIIRSAIEKHQKTARK